MNKMPYFTLPLLILNCQGILLKCLGCFTWFSLRFISISCVNCFTKLLLHSESVHSAHGVCGKVVCL